MRCLRAFASAAQVYPASAIDCSTAERCKQNCPKNGGFANCSASGQWYCCKAKVMCGNVATCATDGNLHDCACDRHAGVKVALQETTTLYTDTATNSAAAGAGADGTAASPAAAMLATRSEFRMFEKDRELVTRYATDLDTTAAPTAGAAPLPAFETDSNGMLMMKRVVNQTRWGELHPEDSLAFHVTMPVAGNYYPLASPGVIRVQASAVGKDARALAVVTDRAHGASSLQSGWVEVMLGRRCAETGSITVDDKDHIDAKNWVFFGADAAATAAAHRQHALRVSTPLVPLVVTGAAPGPGPDGGAALPASIHLLSLDRVGTETTPVSDGGAPNRVLLRLHHIFQEGESPLSADAMANVTALLPPPLRLTDVVEVPLNGVGEPTPMADSALDAVTLYALQTRTFEATLVSK
jgi:hypothetical protein